MGAEIILLDIDHTLFDTDRFFALIQKRLMEIFPDQTDWVTDELQRYHDSLSSGLDFSPASLAAWLAKDDTQKKQEVEALFSNASLYEASVFPEVREVLNELKRTHKLGIFSQGVPAYQRSKLELSGLVDFVEPELIYITDRKTTDEYLRNLPRPVTIVDDDLNVIEVLEQDKAIRPIWMNRKTPDTNHRVKTVKSLTELLEVSS